MLNATYPALSALRALGQKLGVTANNVANVNTNGFKKSRAVLQEANPSGVTVSINKINTPGVPLPAEDGTAETQESSNVALEEEMTGLMTVQRAYTANLTAIKAEDELLGKLFDVFA